MGLPEFYNPIKSSVDEIKISTNAIESNVNEIEGLVNELKGTDMGSLNTKVDENTTKLTNLDTKVNGLGWWTKSSTLFNKVQGTDYPILAFSVSGKGVLTLLQHGYDGNAQWGTIRVDYNVNRGSVYIQPISGNGAVTIPFKSSVFIFMSQEVASTLRVYYTLE